LEHAVTKDSLEWQVVQMTYHTYCHPDNEADEGKDGQLEDEVDVDHDCYGWHKGQSWGHKQQGLPATDA
jgi:hypothetical protein